MQEHIAHCEQCFQAQQQADLVRQLLHPPADDLQPLLAEQRISANIDRCTELLDAATAGNRDVAVSHGNNTGNRRGLSDRLTIWYRALRDSSAAVRLTLLAQSCLLLVAAGVLLWPDTVSQPQMQWYHTQSRSAPQPTATSAIDHYPFYRVVFKPDARETAIRQLLIDIGAQVYAGPSAMGVYTIVGTSEQHPDSDTLAQLRIHPSVLLAERVSYRNR